VEADDREGRSGRETQSMVEGKQHAQGSRDLLGSHLYEALKMLGFQGSPGAETWVLVTSFDSLQNLR